ncbi:acyltransferase [Amycolatopsis sp. GM8]|uniref:acyltransferase family protein n=1 Tax=Amycolatopsis sp. GM8 TaxID=2896530 RepID=UPI001F40A903|nr:acyltransferase [Amycolatopsis sp. GM8]
MSRPNSRKISWDVVRVVAVFSVLLGHITHQGPLAHPELDDYPFRDPAQFGAAALMVISGFFVCQTIRRGGTGRWLWHKIARLLPPYVIAVVITYVAMRFAGAAFNGQSFGSGWFGTFFGPTADGRAWASSWYVPVGQDLLVNLSMVQGWNRSFIWLDGSYWTLPVQLMVFSGAAILWARVRGTRRVQLLAWGLVVLPLVIRFVVIGVDNPAPWAYSVVFGFGLHRMHAFAAGIGIWLWSRGRMGRWQLGFLLAAVVGAQDLHGYPDGAARLPSDIGFAVLLLVICAAAKGRDWTFLRPLAPAFGRLAGISYGVYLAHQELGYILARLLLDAGFPGWVRLPVLLTAAVLAGWLLTTLVERPAHSLLTRPRRTVPSPRTAPDDLLPAPVSSPAPGFVGGPS